ncbi:dCTP pyrophosphatase 1 [Forsythia ovata]|uniref:dCTP pyrophosphatase 1 n=1 Tax=Forsythia ovata TaxID=205694 RepID=A0ABD1V1I4_9LAMI
MKNGILTSNSAGNSGPDPESITNFSPRSLFVAASVIDRKFLGQVQLENNETYEVGEVGELSEIFQWKGEVPRGLPDWEEQEKLHLGEELSDVLLYPVRLSDICGIDLCKAVLRKLELNAIKYSISLCKGSSQKHNQIKTSPEATTSTTSNDDGGV